MRSKGMRFVAALGVLLGASLPAAAGAQAAPRWDDRGTAASGPALEGFYTRVDFGGGVAGRGVRADGFGGRVMWPLAGVGDAAPWLARRTAVGLLGAYTREPARTFTAGQLGLAADLTPVAEPIAGRVEPFLSLGAGVLRTTARTGGLAVRPALRPEVVGVGPTPRAATAADRSATSFMVVPSAGVRVWVRPGVAVQGDLRDVVTVRGDAREHHRAFATGLRLAL
jgi:hypothetical protein